MKKSIKKALCIILALSMVIPTGCGKKKPEEKMNKDTVYSETEIEINLPKDFQINQMSGSGDKLVFSGYEYNETDYTSIPAWCVADQDGGNLVYNRIDGQGWIDRVMVLSDGNVAMLRSDYFEDNSDPENYIYENYYYLTIFDNSGKKISEVDLSEELGVDWVNGILETKDKNIMLAYYGGFAIFDVNCNLKTKKQTDYSDYGNFITMKDGSVITSKWGETGIKYVKFDINTFTEGEEVPFTFNVDRYSIIGVSDKYDFILSCDTGLFGYNQGDAEPTELMNYINSNVSTSYFNNMIALANGDFIGIYYDWTTDEGAIKVCRYTKVDPSTVPDKQVVTLGCMWISDDIRKAVIDYNKKSDSVHIEIKDYSMYETQENWNAGTEKFNTDIASGQGPDIVFSSYATSVSNYSSKGLFLDLTKYIENDPEINKDDIFPNLLEAASYNGKIYEIIPSFYIQTLAAKTSKMNGKTSWTFDEFINTFDSLPEGTSMLGKYTVRESILSSILSVDSEEFVDSKKAKCNLDSESFIKVLELAKRYPKELDDSVWENYDYMEEMMSYKNDKVLLSEYTISDIRGYNDLVRNTFGEDVTFIGYPTASGNGSALYYYNSYGISSKCNNPDAAWDFVRTYLTPEYQSTIEYGIPASMSRFDEMGLKAQEPEENIYMGDMVYAVDEIYPMEATEPITPENVAKLKDFILSVDKVQHYPEDVMSIILEEAEPFFEGQKSAEEVVKIMQSRVSIFLSEKQ